MTSPKHEQSPLVTLDTVETHRYVNNPFASHAVRAGIRQDEFIRILLDHQEEMTKRIQELASIPPPYFLLLRPGEEYLLGKNEDTPDQTELKKRNVE